MPLYTPELAAILGVDVDGRPLKKAAQDKQGRVKVKQYAAPGLDIPNPYEIGKVYGQGRPPSPDQSVPDMDPNPLSRIGRAAGRGVLGGLAYSQEHIGGPIIEALPTPVQKAGVKAFEALLEGTGSATTGAMFGAFDADKGEGPLVQGMGSFGVPIPTQRGLEMAKGALKEGFSAYAKNVMQDTPTLPSEEFKKRGVELSDVEGALADMAVDVGNVINPLAIAGPAVKAAAMLPIVPAARAAVKAGQVAEKAGELAGKATRVVQRITSADTSLKQVPALFKDAKFREALKPGRTHADIGAGAHAGLSTKLLDEAGVTHVPMDPFNRADTVVDDVARLTGQKHPTASAANVLNVIAEPEVRGRVVQQAADVLEDDGAAFFSIYEGSRSGVGKETTKGWQNNLPTKAYVDEIKQHFGDVRVRGNVIEARQPLRETLAGDLWDEWRGTPEAKPAISESVQHAGVVESVRSVLTDDLLTPEWRQLKAGEPDAANSYGHCYAAAEAVYHKLGGKDAGLTPMVARDAKGGTHWWLRDKEGRIIDPTADQYTKAGVEPPYANGKPIGFLTKEPSKRAQEILRRMEAPARGSETGAIPVSTALNVAGTVGGGLAGAAASEDHPLLGGLVGAAAGYGAARMAGKAARGFAAGRAGKTIAAMPTTATMVAEDGVSASGYIQNMVKRVPGRARALGMVDEYGQPTTRDTSFIPAAGEFREASVAGAPPRGIEAARFEGDRQRIARWLDRQGPEQGSTDRAILQYALEDGLAYAYEQRRIHMPWSETERLSWDKTIGQQVRAKGLKKGTALPAEDILALENAMKGLADHAARASDAWREVRRLTDEGKFVEAKVIMDEYGVHSPAAMKQLAYQSYLEAQNVLKSALGVRSEAGRSLNIYKKLLKGKPYGQWADEKFIELAGRLGADEAEVVEMLSNFAPGSRQRYQFLRNMTRADARDLYRWYYMTSLLSGPATHARNLISNTINIAWMRGALSTATAWDAARGRLAWADRKNIIAQYRRGQLDGMYEGWKVFKDIIRDGFSDADMKMLHERPPEIRLTDLGFSGSSEKADRYLNLVSRFLSASDQGAKQVVFSGTLYAEAYKKASKLVRDGKLAEADMMKHAQAIIDDPIVMDPDLWKKAMRVANDATYQNDPGKLLRSLMNLATGTDELADAGIRFFIDKIPSAPVRKTALVATAPFRYAGTTVMPFIKTPANVYKKYFRTMGGGLIPAGFMERAEGATPITRGRGYVTKAAEVGEIEGAIRRGEAMMGLVSMAVLGGLMKYGVIDITGAMPLSENLSEQEGKALDYSYAVAHPHSIRLGPVWLNYQSWGPVTGSLAALGNFNDTRKKHGGVSFAQTMDAATRFGRSMLSASMVSGLMGVIGAFEDATGKLQARMAGRTAAGLVPLSGALRTARRMTDTELRDPGSEDFGTTVVQNVMNILPGLSQQVPPRVTYSGERISVTGGGPDENLALRAVRAISPMNVRAHQPDPVRQQLEQLGPDGYFVKPSKKLKNPVTGEDVPLTPQQQAKLQEVVGQAQYSVALRLLAEPQWRDMPPTPKKAEMLQKFMAKARRRAAKKYYTELRSSSTGKP